MLFSSSVKISISERGNGIHHFTLACFGTACGCAWVSSSAAGQHGGNLASGMVASTHLFMKFKMVSTRRGGMKWKKKCCQAYFMQELCKCVFHKCSDCIEIMWILSAQLGSPEWPNQLCEFTPISGKLVAVVESDCLVIKGFLEGTGHLHCSKNCIQVHCELASSSAALPVFRPWHLHQIPMPSSCPAVPSAACTLALPNLVWNMLPCRCYCPFTGPSARSSAA